MPVKRNLASGDLVDNSRHPPTPHSENFVTVDKSKEALSESAHKPRVPVRPAHNRSADIQGPWEVRLKTAGMTECGGSWQVFEGCFRRKSTAAHAGGNPAKCDGSRSDEVTAQRPQQAYL
jgi:hypothetical protein